MKMATSIYSSLIEKWYTSALFSSQICNKINNEGVLKPLKLTFYLDRYFHWPIFVITNRASILATSVYQPSAARYATAQ